MCIDVNSIELATALELELGGHVTDVPPPFTKRKIQKSGKPGIFLYWYKGAYRTVTEISRLPSVKITLSNLKKRLSGIEDKNNLDISTIMYAPNRSRPYPYGNTTITITQLSELTSLDYGIVLRWLVKDKLTAKQVVCRSRGEAGPWSEPKEYKPRKKVALKKRKAVTNFDDEHYWIKNIIKSLKVMGYRGEQLELEALKRIK